MKINLLILAVFAWIGTAVAAALPTITVNPTNQTAAAGNDVMLAVAGSNANSYQWRFNGADISWGTNATLIVTNAQLNNSGYYMAVAKNGTGWTPSELGYLSVVDTPGTASFGNTSSCCSRVYPLYRCENPTNLTVVLFAGPTLDYMLPMGSAPVSLTGTNYGYYSSSPLIISNVAVGQEMFYRVHNWYWSGCPQYDQYGPFTNLSTTLKIIAGANNPIPPDPTPAVASLTFPEYLEWPEPRIYDFDCYGSGPSVRTQNLVRGETARLVQCADAYYARPLIQWRKDGRFIDGATNTNLTITNFQSADVGLYDAQVLVTYPESGAISEPFKLSIQTTNGEGVFRSPRITGTNFVSDFEGVPTRNYAIHWSTNLTDWTPLLTLTNANGITTMTNPIESNARRYYRAQLLP